MQPALDRTTLDRLIDIGRRKGHLTTEDLRESLPVESMSADDIALVVVHLEELGVAVELEDSLISPDPKPEPVRMQGAEIIPFPGRSAQPKNLRSKSEPLPSEAPFPLDAPLPEPPTGRSAHWAVAIAGLLALVVLGLLILAWNS